MKAELWCINKTTQSFVSEGIDMYVKRIKHYTNFDIHVFPSPKASNKLPLDKLKQAEAQLILNKLKPSDYLILLDEQGQIFDSIEFAKKIEKLQNASHKKIIFLVGGGYGFDSSLKERSNATVSLSKMTFPHELVRIIFLEQLYRAFTIIKGEKYHHI